MSSDPRLDYPATGRNREPILAVLRQVLPSSGTVLEIASGSGQHVSFFAEALPDLHWQPSDVEPGLLASIRAWSEPLDNVAPPVELDVTSPAWPLESCDAVFCANMVHIAPWEACLGLLAGAGRVLRDGGPLCLYGPFMVQDRHTAPSNAAFDRSLAARDSRWGVRDLDAVEKEAKSNGLELDRVFEMPANNLTVVFRAKNGLKR